MKNEIIFKRILQKCEWDCNAIFKQIDIWKNNEKEILQAGLWKQEPGITVARSVQKVVRKYLNARVAYRRVFESLRLQLLFMRSEDELSQSLAPVYPSVKRVQVAILGLFAGLYLFPNHAARITRIRWTGVVASKDAPYLQLL